MGRWASIGNMIQFANAVYGTNVGNWVSGSDMLAFSRGNKGFFAMGNVNGDFDTGLPDGEYCDVVSECQQMITVSGGRGHFKPYSGDEPAVAICVGCGDTAETTARPTTTTTTQQSTAAPTTTSTASSSPATTAEGWCCDAVTLGSTAGVAQHYPELLGEYEDIGEEEHGRPVFRRQTILTTVHLHYTQDPYYKWEGWMVTAGDNDTFGYLANEGSSNCPLGLASGWEYQVGAARGPSPLAYQVHCAALLRLAA